MKHSNDLITKFTESPLKLKKKLLEILPKKKVRKNPSPKKVQKEVKSEQEEINKKEEEAKALALKKASEGHDPSGMGNPGAVTT